MAQNRMHFKDTFHFVTNRTEHEMFLLLPNERIKEIVQCWFARALCLFGQGLDIYAFVFLSDHFHLLCKDNRGTLAAFMWYFQGNVARAINKELGRKGRFWSREYDDVIVPGEAEFWDRYGYTLANAVKAGLVERSCDWPGWSSLDGALTDGKYRFEMLNKTKLHNATRRGQKVDKSKFVDVWEFQLAVPPALEGKSAEERHAFIEKVLENAEATFRMSREGKPALGAERILSQSPLDRALSPSFRPRIKVLCFDREEKKLWHGGYRIFIGGYRETFDGFRKAAALGRRPTVEWPEGSYPPSCLYPIGHAA